MNFYLAKELKGSVYYLKPNLLYQLIQSLVQNLIKQGFKKIYIITGHSGSGQLKVLKKIEKNNKKVCFINPYEKISVKVNHADEYETSLFWACYPKEVERGLKIKILKTDDYFKYAGFDPRKKASLAKGRKMLKEMVWNSLEKMKPLI